MKPSPFNILYQVARFGVVGLMNVAINAVIYMALVYLGVHYILASAVGAIIGVLNSFVWSRLFVFKTQGKVAPQLVKTLMVYGAQIAISWAGLIVLIEFFHIDPYSAYILNVTIVTLISFLGLKYFAFSTRNKATEGGEP